MGGPRFTGVRGPLEEYEVGFSSELAGQGYAKRTVRLQVRLMADVSLWLACEGLGVGDLTLGVAERFMADRCRAGRRTHVTVRSVRPLLDYLDTLGVRGPEGPVVLGPVEEVLDRFGRYLAVERGLAAGTIAGYLAAVRPFVTGRWHGENVEFFDLRAAEVSRFVVAVCPGRPQGSAKLIVTGMRSLLGWLHLEGMMPIGLAAAVPAVASRRLKGLPEPLSASQVRSLLAACDRRSPVGRRDFAMIMLLWRLGLRAGEVARLGLDDVDWRAGELTVTGKGPKTERLPLPTDVGEAVVGWLHRGRPPTAMGRTVFVRVVAPHGALSPTGVTQAVFAAGRRAGLGTLHAHRLRHTAASDMLAAGASMSDIGQVLRHRRILTTATYAKIDIAALRSAAPAWPGNIR